ncbi:MAG TPA: response regulator [Alphaproteobacteria bacterium]|nr:response regulator [Alphaproteobacteria bacterium]
MAVVLVIEDDDHLRRLLRAVLERAGHTVEDAPNGAVGLKTFSSRPADIVVTDIIMPEKEGLETIIELKRDYPKVKIIAISGGGARLDAQYLPSAKALGADMTIEKPFEPREVIEAVGGLLQEQAAHP